MLSFLLAAALSAIYAVDLGADRIRVGVAAAGGEFSIQSTPAGKRSALNCVAFGLNDTDTSPWAHRWYAGDDTIVVSSHNSSRAVRDPFRCLADASGFPLAHVHPIVASAVLVASQLPNFVPKNDRIVAVIPTRAPPQFRYALSYVLEAANAALPTLIERSSAVAACYVIERLNRSLRAAQNVMFVDVGAAATEVSHWRFRTANTLTTAELVNFRATDLVGGAAADRAIMAHVVNATAREPSGDLERLCRSAKEQVAFGYNATVGEVNITGEVMRDILRPMCEMLIEIVRTFITSDLIEFVGGASRLRVFREAVMRFLPEISVLTSLNPEEATTFGAVYHEAIQAKILYGQKIQLNVTSPFSFTVKRGDKSRELLPRIQCSLVG
jgi:hypothetical protein